MANLIGKTQCPECRDNGRDNLALYDDGSSWCFGCNKMIDNSEEGMEVKLSSSAPRELIKGEYKDIPNRGISKETCRFFNYEVGTYMGHAAHIAPYFNQYGELVAQKIRMPDKKMTVLGDGKNLSLFGQTKYEPNKNVFVTVVEGEIDALTVAEVQGTRFPVVSVPNGAGGAKKSLAANLEWLKGFKHVVLALDNDEAGLKAAKDCIDLFDPGSVRLCKWTMKDPNEMHTSGRSSEIVKCLFNAQTVRPEGIIKLNEIQDSDILEAIQPGIPIKFPILNNMLNGIRKQSLYTLVARAKAGKTTLTKEIVLDLVNRGHKVGVLYLEEDAISEALSFIAMEENIPSWKFNDILLSDPEGIKRVHDKLASFGDRGLYLYNHKGVIDADAVYNTVSYMVKALDCEIIVLDNISISIAGSDAATNERKTIDNMVFKLVQLINNTKCTILTVVHVNQKGEGEDTLQRKDVFGSGAFLKFSRGLIGLDRTSDGLVKLSVLANRAKGVEGEADTLLYNEETGRLELIEEAF